MKIKQIKINENNFNNYSNKYPQVGNSLKETIYIGSSCNFKLLKKRREFLKYSHSIQRQVMLLLLNFRTQRKIRFFLLELHSRIEVFKFDSIVFPMSIFTGSLLSGRLILQWHLLFIEASSSSKLKFFQGVSLKKPFKITPLCLLHIIFHDQNSYLRSY